MKILLVCLDFLLYNFLVNKFVSTSNMAIKKSDAKSSTTPNKGENKPTLHPNYRIIKVEMTDGEVYETRSTYHNNVLKLDVDKKTHPAWTREANYINAKASEVAKFNDKFKGLSFLK